MSVSCDFCVLSGRDLCDELITRPEKTYLPTVMCRCVCSRNIKNEEAMVRFGRQRHRQKEIISLFLCRVAHGSMLCLSFQYTNL
jgi:hypothetical protein